MKTQIRWKLIPIGIGLVTLAGFVGSISGSLAWWSYSTRASIEYSGTAVTTNIQLQMGLRLDKTKFTDEEVEDLVTTHSLTEDLSLETGDYRYVFSKEGGEGLTKEIIASYLQYEGLYAVNELSPITSNVYTQGDVLTLKDTMLASHPEATMTAPTTKYFKIPFVFRVKTLYDDDFVPNQYIWLDDITAKATTPAFRADRGIRTYFSSTIDGTPKRLVINPTAEVSGVSKVYGVLDLNNDGIYDYDGDEEILYGPASVTSLASNTFVQAERAAGHEDDFDNMNGVEDVDAASTFLAQHKVGATCYRDYTGIAANLGNQQYYCLDDVKSTTLAGVLNQPEKALCKTGDIARPIAELEMTCWLEGWDHSVVDRIISYGFNLGLTFEINLVS